MKCKSFVLFLMMLCLYPAMTLAQSDPTGDTIDTFVRERMNALELPGAALAIVRGEEIVHLEGYGVANDAGDPVTPQTPFLLASLTKSMTAVAVMQLVEAGEVRLDAPIQEYLPWFIPETIITVRQLLNQTSGLDEGQGYERGLERDGPDALEESIRRLATVELNRPPGNAFEYSNSNYDVLGLLVETVSGQSYGAYLQANLFAPLQMGQTFTSLEAARGAGMSNAFYPLFGRQTNLDGWMPYTRAQQPSAGVISSGEDMAHYLIAHLNDGRYGNNHVLSPESVDALHNPAVEIDNPDLHYAMGWVAWRFREAVADETAAPPLALSHGGDWLGFRHIMLLVPEHHLGLVWLTSGHDPTLGSAADNVAFDAALLAMGFDAQNYPPQEDLLRRNQRPLGMVMILLLLVAAPVAVVRLRGRFSRRDRWLFAGLAVFDLALVLYILGYRLFELNTSVRHDLRFTPDLTLMSLVILVLAAGWGSVRTLWAIRIWRERMRQ